jgi:hypothetical protein
MSNTTPTEIKTLKDRIVSILTESTGIAMMDSGGANGRGWQRNRLIDDWDAIQTVSLEVFEDEVIVSYSVYHYLMNFLDITDKSERINSDLQRFFYLDEDTPYHQDVEEFISELETEGDIMSCNTYNYDNILSGVLQYTIFQLDDNDFYIVLQVHNGADVRGGYTVPQIFSLGSDEDMAHFGGAQYDIGARCDCSDWWSDDTGAHYYLDGSCPSPHPDWIYDADNDRVMCRKCGKEVVFSVTECW